MLDYPVPLPRALLERPPAARVLLRREKGAAPVLLGEILFYNWMSGSLLLARLAGLSPGGLFQMEFQQQSIGDGLVPLFPTEETAGPNLPPMLSCHGKVFSLNYTDAFRPRELFFSLAVLSTFAKPPVQIACGVVLPR